MENTFGTNLRRLRKAKGVTQEQLADAVGVSPQAVSKWEIGSYPDPQLLPAVADFLETTIDDLFGRDTEKEIDMRERIVRHIHDLSAEKMFSEMFELCYGFCQAANGGVKYHPIEENILNAKDWYNYSQVEWDQGLALSSNCGSLQYFLLMPRPAGGYDGVLAFDPKMIELFRFLSLPNVLRAFYFLTGRGGEMFFNGKTLEHELKTTPKNAEEIIQGMLSLGFIWEASLNGGKTSEKIYQYSAAKQFLPFLTFAWLLLHPPTGFSYSTQGRQAPFFERDTYKEDLSEKE